MPITFPPIFVLALFYIIFLCQIYCISIYYPQKITNRIVYVLSNFSPEEYPKLYPGAHDGFVGEVNRKLGMFMGVNYAIAVFGLAILGYMWASGYEPALKGGDEIFVMGYFFLQVSPFLVVSAKEYKYYKMLRRTFRQRVRLAELRPRRIFDFVPRWMVGTAGLFYVVFLLFFLNGESALEPAVYISVGMITLVNLVYIFVIRHYVKGIKLDPYRDGKDQARQAEGMAKVLTVSSILMSAFLVLTKAADRYALEVFDPALASFYLQLCLVMSTGLTMRIDKIEDINFDVYKEDAVE